MALTAADLLAIIVTAGNGASLALAAAVALFCYLAAIFALGADNQNHWAERSVVSPSGLTVGHGDE